MKTATVTKIKGLSIQTQQNTFVLFTLFKLTLDERKTPTKISMRKPLTTVPQNQRKLQNKKTGKKHFARDITSQTTLSLVWKEINTDI